MNNPPSKELILHQGSLLEKSEYDILIILQNVVGEIIPVVSKDAFVDIGVCIEKNQIIELNLSGKHLSSIPEYIGDLKNLISLNLGMNNLSDLPLHFSNLIRLQKLKLDNNDFISLPNIITKLHNLEFLNLHNNHIISLPESIGDLTQLKDLILSSNNLTSLPNNFEKLQNLMYLDLSINQLTILPEWIGSLSNLEKLYLTQNKWISLPKTLNQLNRLKSLNFDEFDIFRIPKKIRKSIKLLRKIKCRDLSAFDLPFVNENGQSSDKYKPLAQLKWGWIFTYFKISTEEMKEIKPLSDTYSREKWKEFIHPTAVHPMLVPERIALKDPIVYVDENWTSEKKMKKLGKKIQNIIGMDENETIIFFWRCNQSVETTWKFFLNHITSFCFNADESFFIIFLHDSRALIGVNGMLRAFFLVDRKIYFGQN